MIIYSIEIQIEEDISEEWLIWMQNKHIADMMSTKLFTNFYFLKNMKKDNNYIIQYELENNENLVRYEREFAKKLQAEHMEKYQNKFQAKRSVYIKHEKWH